MRVSRISMPMAALLAAATFAGAAEAAEEEFLNQFAGSWSGSGTVQVRFEQKPRKVKCDLEGSHDGRSVTIDGTCRAHLIFSRRIGVDVAPASGGADYTGTYTGSKAGPAQLSGERQGSGLTFTINWPKEINGDRIAMMRVISEGGRRLRILVFDQVDGRGELRPTTELVLARR